MRKIIIGMAGCQKCKMLKEKRPDMEYIEIDPSIIVPLARELKFSEMPFVVTTGSVEELDETTK